jgi:hypothetical protein
VRSSDGQSILISEWYRRSQLGPDSLVSVDLFVRSVDVKIDKRGAGQGRYGEMDFDVFHSPLRAHPLHSNSRCSSWQSSRNGIFCKVIGFRTLCRF